MFCPEAIALSGGNAAEAMNGKPRYRIGQQSGPTALTAQIARFWQVLTISKP
jgi:hypothetical protein